MPTSLLDAWPSGFRARACNSRACMHVTSSSFLSLVVRAWSGVFPYYTPRMAACLRRLSLVLPLPRPRRAAARLRFAAASALPLFSRLPVVQRTQLEDYLSVLLEWNAKMNLVSARSVNASPAVRDSRTLPTVKPLTSTSLHCGYASQSILTPTLRQLLLRHVEDSLTLLVHLGEESVPLSLIDVGTGASFIHSRRHYCSSDSRRVRSITRRWISRSCHRSRPAALERHAAGLARQAHALFGRRDCSLRHRERTHRLRTG